MHSCYKWITVPYTVQPLLKATLGKMDKGRLKGVGRLIDIKTTEQPHRDYEYWPNRNSFFFDNALLNHGIFK